MNLLKMICRATPSNNAAEADRAFQLFRKHSEKTIVTKKFFGGERLGCPNGSICLSWLLRKRALGRGHRGGLTVFFQYRETNERRSSSMVVGRNMAGGREVKEKRGMLSAVWAARERRHHGNRSRHLSGGGDP